MSGMLLRRQMSSNANAAVSRVGILGASGYTGAECCRLIANHPQMDITVMTANRYAGKHIHQVFPQLRAMKELPQMVAVGDVDWSAVDAVFCCLPHGTTQEIIASLPVHLKVVDLSADFRLKDIAEYKEWYGLEHKASKLQEEVVYGLTEVARDEIAAARIVANPGCYPTSVQIPLHPLLKQGLIQPEDIIIDAKSGTSGAGRDPKEGTLYCEVTEGMHAYGITNHRHVPEIEQGLSEAAGAAVNVSFTPHLMPMSRGMQSTIYCKTGGTSTEDVRAALQKTYEDDPFVIVLDEGGVPATRHVRGSNYCVIGVYPDRLPGRVIIVSVIDNLVKGASGQAIQNMNLMLGLPESMGIDLQPVFP